MKPPADKTLRKRGVKLGYHRALLEPMASKADRDFLNEVHKQKFLPESLRRPSHSWTFEEILTLKFESLARHYGCFPITSQNALYLAFQLAMDWVPGLQILPSTYEIPKPRAKSESAVNHIYETMNLILSKNPTWSIAKAAKQMQADPSTRVLTQHKREATPQSSRSVETRYREAHRRRRKLLVDIFKATLGDKWKTSPEKTPQRSTPRAGGRWESKRHIQSPEKKR
jgi:hypothetical protein